LSQKKSLGLLAAVAVAGLVAASCSSSSGGSPATIQHKDGGQVIVGTGDAGEAGAGVVADGTSGKQCKVDADCTTPNGPGINKCSNGMLVTVALVRAQLLPTPVCKVPFAGTGNCDPAPPTDPQGMGVHFCDGADDPSSPGICVPGTSTPAPGQGVCEVHCTFSLDGSPPKGCAGKDTCVPYYFSSDSTGAIIGGGGFCQGSCERDSDCSDLGTGWLCQTDLGFCTQHLVTRKKAIGAACSQSARVNDLTTGACNCQLVSSTTGNGYCTSACIVGGSVPCPNGYICDNNQSNPLPDGTTLQLENVQTPGYCVPGCSLGGDAGTQGPQVEAGGSDAAGASDGATESGAGAGEAAAPAACPPNSTCQLLTPLGPTCLP
jgi:hypothetical protein